MCNALAAETQLPVDPFAEEEEETKDTTVLTPRPRGSPAHEEDLAGKKRQKKTESPQHT